MTMTNPLMNRVRVPAPRPRPMLTDEAPTVELEVVPGAPVIEVDDTVRLILGIRFRR